MFARRRTLRSSTWAVLARSPFLSPGLSYTVSPQVQLYAFAQLPLYRYVNGTQLAVNWAAVGGVTFRF